ncbi:MAG: YbjN domain-containing protein [Alphaproteobacteria bacterium]|nr:YbjN domain-containing protein [Alphaproteobacteria bacterium]
MNAKETAALVEAQLTEYGLDPADSRIEPFRLGHWAFSAGSAEVQIVIEEGPTEGELILEARSPILVLSGDTGRLFAHVLELNATIVGGAFSVANGMLEVRANRRTDGLSQDELHQLVMDVAALADHYDDELSGKFGMRREADL